MSDDIEYVDICCEFKTHTEKAVLVHDGGDDVWIPKSVIQDVGLHDFDNMERGDSITLQVAEWFAENEGLI